jgi:histone acetyltransferase
MFKRDVLRVFTNAREYNNVNTVYYKCANELEKYISPYLEQLKEDESADESENYLGISKTSKKIKKRKR